MLEHDLTLQIQGIIITIIIIITTTTTIIIITITQLSGNICSE